MLRLATILLTLFITHAAVASEQTDTEIEYVLDFVESSGCTFHRNGSDHDSADAADHMRLKYNRGKKYVGSSEQFIDRLATESSWTGRDYTVTCDGTTRPSGEWLHEALDAYRSTAGG